MIFLFIFSGNLHSHYITHHKNLALKCGECEFATSSKKTYREHVKTHTVNTELQCTTCNYQCANKSSLRNHMKRHLTEKPFKCNVCSYSSSQFGNLQMHVKRKHPGAAVNKHERKSKLEERIILPKDPEHLRQEAIAKDKMKSKCVKSYKCNQCAAAFVREDSLKCHIKQHSDSSLSTAYAVLRLQQPVINPSHTQISTVVTSTPVQSISQSPCSTALATKQTYMTSGNDPVSQGQVGQGQMTVSQGQVSLQSVREELSHNLTTSTVTQSQQVNLGINDILMAAGMSGISSVGDSPNSTATRFQVPAPGTTTTIMSPRPSQDGNIVCGTTVCQSPNEVPSVQVMQNISLPYIRLPNGQVLILTGQTSLNQPANQAGQAALTDSAQASAMTAELTSQLLVQQPELSRQVVQCAADSTTAIQPNTSHSTEGLPTQQGAIPIQIILPSDSQQALPLVSQLLSSVMNKPADDTGGPQVPVQTCQQTQAVQNFVLQIPTQTGSMKDAAGTVPESQSYVLQIPGTNFHPV